MKGAKLKDKVAIVTGSSMGIGKVIAKDFASQGAKVVLNGQDHLLLAEAENELLIKGADVIAVRADVRSMEDCERLIGETLSAFGRIDVLVNNAALSTRGSVEEMDPAIFGMIMDTNVLGSVFPTKCVLPYLKNTQGSIIFINSLAGICGWPYNSIYSCSKTAQAILADALRIELSDTGVHVGVVMVNFTQNDPRKKILNADGRWIYLPRRNNVFLDRPDHVAKRVRHMIEKRKNRIVLTRLGKFTCFLQRWFPSVLEFILWLNRNKIKKEYTHFGGDPVESEVIQRLYMQEKIQIREPV